MKPLPLTLLSLALALTMSPERLYGERASAFQAKLCFRPGAAPAMPLPHETIRPRVIVIDPGHGGEDRGVVSPTGVEERFVTLEIAARLKELLMESLGCQVILTREGDQAIPLTERTGMANHHKADLLLSIHANASFSGATWGCASLVYSPEANRESYQRARGPAGTTMWNHLQEAHVPQSLLLATLIQVNVAERGITEARGVHGGPVLLLEGANMPAVVVEVGFLTNHEEERKLKSGGYLERMAEALAAAIKDFTEARRWFGP